MRRWNRYEATKYAFLGFIGRKPGPTGAGGGIVKRGDIVLKDVMGYVDKLIGWIGRHKTLSALGIASLFGLGLYATNDYVKNTVDKDLKFAKEKAVGAALFGGVPPVTINNVVPAANATVKATPAITPQPDFLMYDGIIISGDEQFQKDVVMSLEFVKKYSPMIRSLSRKTLRKCNQQKD